PVIDNLRALDLPHLAVPHGSIADVYQAITLIGNRCDRPQTARRLINLIRSDIDALKMSARALNIVPKRLLVVLGSMPVPPKATFVAGPASFLDNLVEMAGHTNIAHEVLKDAYGEIPLENLRILDPEVILEFRDQPDTKQMDQLYGSWSEVGMLQAIQHRRVRSIGGPQWLSAGPRIAVELHRFITVLSEFR
ncbi:MAG: ABC transporter substrate-binding protein, partial [Planctomycetota bacterium]